MSLELNQIASQVKAMGRSLSGQTVQRDEAKQHMQELLHRFSTAYIDLANRIVRAEEVQKKQRFDWTGAAPTTEALAETHSLPAKPERVTVIASDGSQILPDHHAITIYYLINVGCIIYQHGSNRKPETFSPKPILCYDPEDTLDEQGRIIALSEVNVKRDLAEFEVLVTLAPAYTRSANESVVVLADGPLSLRIIDLPFRRQQECQNQHIQMFNQLRESGALMAGYIDRPHSNFVVSLMHLASLQFEAINEANMRQNPFRHLTDLDLFDFLGPGERSAIFIMKTKGVEKYEQTGHGIHFFYLNVSQSRSRPNIARVEVPAWLVANLELVDTLHTTLVRQARLTGGYPYVLARAHELAIISNEEREAVEMMLAVEMRRNGLIPNLSPKQYNKNLLNAPEYFKF